LSSERKGLEVLLIINPKLVVDRKYVGFRGILSTERRPRPKQLRFRLDRLLFEEPTYLVCLNALSGKWFPKELSKQLVRVARDAAGLFFRATVVLRRSEGNAAHQDEMRLCGNNVCR
jgi:hypothetical protein